MSKRNKAFNGMPPVPMNYDLTDTSNLSTGLLTMRYLLLNKDLKTIKSERQPKYIGEIYEKTAIGKLYRIDNLSFIQMIES